MLDARRAIALIPVAAWIACASGPTQLYEGPARPREEVASIIRVAGSKAHVWAIDQQRTFSGEVWWVLPGAHTVWVDFQVTRFAGDMTYTIWAYCRIDFEAKGGGTYTVAAFDPQEQMKGPDVKTKLGAGITDASGKIVGAAGGCVGKRPSLD
jgi:hypothetical protein